MTSKDTATMQSEVCLSDLSNRIYTLRGCKVMLDSDLAEIYDVETKVLKRAVRRNFKRFPNDFLFELTTDELANLRCQFGTSSLNNESQRGITPNLTSKIGTSSLVDKSSRHGGDRYSPFAFTEPGVAMLSSVLHSESAIQVNIGIMRVFIQLRKLPAAHQIDLVPKIESLENRFDALSQRVDRFEDRFQNNRHSKSDLEENDRVSVIQNAVARRWGVGASDLKSAVRTKSISLPRQIAIFLVRKHLCMGFREIGEHFGQRDHTTILHAYRKIKMESAASNMIGKAIQSLQHELKLQIF